MTELEICGSYRRAENKDKQIKVLTELTLKDEYEIMSIIVRNGYDLTEKQVERLMKKLDALEAKIYTAEQEYKKVVRALTGRSR